MKEFFRKYKVYVIAFVILSLFILIFLIIYNIISNQKLIFIEEGNEEYFTNDIKAIESGNLYFKRGNNIYYRSYRPPEGTFCLKKAKGVDLKTFETIEFKNWIGSFPYAKDKNNVYFSGVKIKNADPKTFNFLCGDYFEDKNNLYFRGGQLNDLDKMTFKIIDCKENYIIDNNYVWHGVRRLKPFLDSGYVDKKNFLDPKTFEILGRHYLKDKNGIYFNLLKIDETDFATFEVIDEYHTKDKNNVYFYYKKINNADPKTFEVLGRLHSRDENFCFYEFDEYNVKVVSMSECDELTK